MHHGMGKGNPESRPSRSNSRQMSEGIPDLSESERWYAMRGRGTNLKRFSRPYADSSIHPTTVSLIFCSLLDYE